MVLIKLFAEKQWRHKHREHTYWDGVRQKGEGEIYRGNSKET